MLLGSLRGDRAGVVDLIRLDAVADPEVDVCHVRASLVPGPSPRRKARLVGVPLGPMPIGVSVIVIVRMLVRLGGSMGCFAAPERVSNSSCHPDATPPMANPVKNANTVGVAT